MAGTYIFRTVSGPDRSQFVNGAPPTMLANWEQVLPSGHTIGGQNNAPVTMVVFSDLECPACRAFHPVVQKLLDSHPQDLKVVFVHNPLDMHRFAMPAARASECAAKTGKFAGWVNSVYDKQDSLGIKSWASYASDAGIEDTLALEICAKDPKPVANIEAGLDFAGKASITATPTIMINGWKYSGVPTSRQLDSAVTMLTKLATR